MSNYNKNNYTVRNVIRKVIPLYPECRRLSDCSRGELLLNGIIRTLLENSRKDLPYYQELLSIVNEFVHDLRAMGVSEDRWEIYSAAIISHIDLVSEGLPSAYIEYSGRDLCKLVRKNEVSTAVFRMAEALIELRNMVDGKRSDKPYRTGKTYDGGEMDERYFRETIEKVEECMPKNPAFREYHMLLENVFGNTDSTWECLNRTGAEGLKDMLFSLPQRCVLSNGELYRVDGFERFSYSTNQIDDIEFGPMTTGITVFITRVDGNSSRNICLYDNDDKTWRQILKERKLQIPDMKTWEFMADLMPDTPSESDEK